MNIEHNTVNGILLVFPVNLGRKLSSGIYSRFNFGGFQSPRNNEIKLRPQINWRLWCYLAYGKYGRYSGPQIPNLWNLRLFTDLNQKIRWISNLTFRYIRQVFHSAWFPRNHRVISLNSPHLFNLGKFPGKFQSIAQHLTYLSRHRRRSFAMLFISDASMQPSLVVSVYMR